MRLRKLAATVAVGWLTAAGCERGDPGPPPPAAGLAGDLAPRFEASPACEGIFGQGSFGLPA